MIMIIGKDLYDKELTISEVEYYPCITVPIKRHRSWSNENAPYNARYSTQQRAIQAPTSNSISADRRSKRIHQNPITAQTPSNTPAYPFYPEKTVDRGVNACRGSPT